MLSRTCALGESWTIVFSRFKRTGKRDDIFLATKFGMTMTGARGEPEYVKDACAKSLERLGVDQIDLYYLHRSV